MQEQRDVNQLVVLDARSIPRSRITTSQAARFLAEAAIIAGQASVAEQSAERNPVATQSETDSDEQQVVVV